MGILIPHRERKVGKMLTIAPYINALDLPHSLVGATSDAAIAALFMLAKQVMFSPASVCVSDETNTKEQLMMN